MKRVVHLLRQANPVRDDQTELSARGRAELRALVGPDVVDPSHSSVSVRARWPRVATAGAALVAVAVAAVLVLPGYLKPPGISAVPAQSPSVTPAATPIELRGDGLGSFRFGASEAEVTEYLESELGKSTHTRQHQKCEIVPDSPWMRIIEWGDFWVEFDAETKSGKAPRTLVAWGHRLNVGPRWSIQDNPPLDLTFTELEKAYPRGKTEDHAADVRTFALPNKIYFVGEGDHPDQLQAGEFLVCE